MINLDELIEVRLSEPDDFLKVRETLSRIGVASKKDKTLYQSCHILHKQGRYYILHFKQLFLLDGKSSDFSDEDRGRLHTITNLLSEWKLLSLVDPDKSRSPVAPMSQIKIIPHSEKNQWSLITKYNIGKRKRED
jgi:hypothetical protein